MNYKKRGELQGDFLPGRIITKVTGKDSPMKSKKMTMGFGRYCKEAGIMAPHQHAEEIVYVVDCKGAWTRYGGTPDNLLYKLSLEKGMTMLFDELEWHVFEYEEDGFLEIIFFYGQTDNIRPEEIK
ncbi:MAG: hypothetical protein FWF86_03435 [Clostridia bacterium]|nr:hypothetical protein [Clostridia bacterium]